MLGLADIREAQLSFHDSALVRKGAQDMCYAGNCNPECGTCSPKKIVAVECPTCGARNTIRREEYLHHFELPHRKSIMEEKMLEKGLDYSMSCVSCGENLESVYKDAVRPQPCVRLGIVCGFPCGRCIEEPNGSNERCGTMVPLGKIGDWTED